MKYKVGYWFGQVSIGGFRVDRYRLLYVMGRFSVWLFRVVYG